MWYVVCVEGACMHTQYPVVGVSCDKTTIYHNILSCLLHTHTHTHTHTPHASIHTMYMYMYIPISASVSPYIALMYCTHSIGCVLPVERPQMRWGRSVSAGILCCRKHFLTSVLPYLVQSPPYVPHPHTCTYI